MWKTIKKLLGIRNKTVEPEERNFQPTGKCPVCGESAQLRFTQGGGMPYESCGQHQIKALLLLCHQRNYTVIGTN
jgi:hypothetical protein